MILSPLKKYFGFKHPDTILERNLVSPSNQINSSSLFSNSLYASEMKTLQEEEIITISQKLDYTYQLFQELKYQECFNQLLDIERTHFDISNIILLSIIKYDLGILYDFYGNYKLALEKFQEALRYLPEEYTDTSLYLSTLESIAITQDNNGNHSEALNIYQNVLSKKVIKYGDKSLEVAITNNNMGIAYYNIGKFEECANLFQITLEFLMQSGKENSLEYGILIMNKGSVFHDQGDYSKAQELSTKANNIFFDLFPNHPLTAYSANNQGFVYKTSGLTTNAELYIRKAYKILTGYFNEGHPDIAKLNNNFGIVYLKRRNYDLAMKFFQVALESRKILFAENHLDVGKTANNIGLIYFYQDDYDLSLYYYRLSLDIYLKTFGEEHPNVSIIYNNIGYSLASQQKYKEAIEHYLKAIKFRDKTLGKNDTYLAMTFMNLGSLLEFRESLWLGRDGQKKAFTINYKNFKWQNNDVETSFRRITSIEMKYDELKYLDSNFEI